MTIRFEVSRVERARAPLPPLNFPAWLNGPPEALDGTSTWDLISAHDHGLLGAVHEAYAHHYPLILSPDAIWLAIAQGFAQHVSANADRLRGKFVRHERKETIQVRRDDFIKGMEEPWPEIFSAFSEAIAPHIGPQRDLTVCHFSTTGPCERAASEIVLLGSMKHYFKYEMITRCGIPEITLEGTVDDWRSIRRRARALEEYDLEWWAEGLGPVLDQLVATAEGRVDVRFWEMLFKSVDGSGGPYVQGWINVLFPYLATDRDGTLTRNDRVTGWAKEFGSDYGGGPNEGMILSGLSYVPFKWLFRHDVYDMVFLGGFVGTEQDPDTLALRPVIGWAVREADPYDAPSDDEPDEEAKEPAAYAVVGHPEWSEALIAGRIVGDGELTTAAVLELDERVAELCVENGVQLARAPVDFSQSMRDWEQSVDMRLVVGVKVVAKSGSGYFFSIDDLRGALEAAQAVPEAFWAALGEVAPGALENETALYLVSPRRSWAGELVYGSPEMLWSVRVAEVAPRAPCALVDVSREAHGARVEAAREMGIEEGAGRYKLG